MSHGISWVFDALGTRWSIDIGDESSDIQVSHLYKDIRHLVDEFDKVFSRFLEDSLIANISKTPGTYIFPSYADPLFALYDDLYDLTDGRCTPLIGGLLSDLGYDASYSFIKKPLSALAEWKKDAKYISTIHTIEARIPVIIDVGAAGKGYCVDLVGEFLGHHGIKNVMIDAGGDIRVFSEKNTRHRIGLEDPRDPTQVIGVAEVSNQSICGSSPNRRVWKEYHHIIDTKTLSPTRDILATWVIADNCMTADACATCLFFSDPAPLREKYHIEYVILYPDYSIDISSSFPGEAYIT